MMYIEPVTSRTSLGLHEPVKRLGFDAAPGSRTPGSEALNHFATATGYDF